MRREALTHTRRYTGDPVKCAVLTLIGVLIMVWVSEELFAVAEAEQEHEPVQVVV